MYGMFVPTSCWSILFIHGACAHEITYHSPNFPAEGWLTGTHCDESWSSTPFISEPPRPCMTPAYIVFKRPKRLPKSMLDGSRWALRRSKTAKTTWSSQPGFCEMMGISGGHNWDICGCRNGAIYHGKTMTEDDPLDERTEQPDQRFWMHHWIPIIVSGREHSRCMGQRNRNHQFIGGKHPIYRFSTILSHYV